MTQERKWYPHLDYSGTPMREGEFRDPPDGLTGLPTPATPLKIRQFTLMAQVSGPLQGDINDWPPRIQDGVYKALEEKAKQVERPLTILATWCDTDFDGYYFVYAVASEIIAVVDGAKEGYLL